MSDHDERVQQVIDELDPTPAHEIAWPVSRRQTLRALAAAGLLGAGAGSASAQSAGGVIADEAVLSNYGSESVSDGWEVTIDDDVFALTASDTETMGLPDGGVGSELVTPSGVEASEFVGPDGTVVFEGDAEIPDSGDFQHNDLTGNYGGDTGAFAIQDGTVFTGDYALESTETGSSHHAIVRSTQDPWGPPIKMSYQKYVPSGQQDGGIMFACQSVDGYDDLSGYILYLANSGDDIEIRRLESGSTTTLSSTSVSVSTNAWNSGSLEWRESNGTDTITWEFAGETLTANDDTFTEGRLGFNGWDGPFWDDIGFSRL